MDLVHKQPPALPRATSYASSWRGRGLLILFAFIAIFASVQKGPAQEVSPWQENFDSYPTDSTILGRGGWAGWDNNSAANARIVGQPHDSAPNALRITGASDAVRRFSGVASGQWVFRTHWYVSSESVGDSYFILLNKYAPSTTHVPKDWSVDVAANAQDGTVKSLETNQTLPLIKNQWIELRAEIDLDANHVKIFYNGELLTEHPWTGPNGEGGQKAIEAVDLYSDNPRSLSYHDNMVMVPMAELNVNPNYVGPGCCYDFDIWQTTGDSGNYQIIEVNVPTPGVTITSASSNWFTNITFSGNTLLAYTPTTDGLWDSAYPDHAQHTLQICFASTSSVPIQVVFTAKGVLNPPPCCLPNIDRDIRVLTLTDPSCQCVEPLRGLILWTPFEGVSSQGETFNLSKGPDGKLSNPPPTSIPGKYGNAYHFNGSNQYVEVPPHAALNMGKGDLSIVAWVRPSANQVGVHTIMDKRTDNLATRGYHLFLVDRRLGFQLADGTHINWSAPLGKELTPNEWHCVAVAVDRDSPTGGKLYVDGVNVLTFNPTSRSGSLDNISPFRVGCRSFAVSGVFDGDIDEVMVFRRSLNIEEIQQACQAVCKSYCELPWGRIVCKGATSVTVTAYICNGDWLPRTYNYSFAPSPTCPPSGVGSVPGPTNFTYRNPSTGSVTVFPNTCEPVTVQIDTPAGFTGNKPLLACYQMTIVDSLTGETHTCEGSLIYRPNLCVIWRYPDVKIGPHLPIFIDPTVISAGDSGDPKKYRIRAIGPDRKPDTRYVSLNGLPPGEPVLGEIVMEPGREQTLPFTAMFVEYDPMRPYTLLIETEEEGGWTPLDSFIIQNTVLPLVPNLTGVVALEGCQTPAERVIDFEFRPIPSGNPISIRTTLDGNSTFTLIQADIPLADYNVWVKGPTHLAKVVPWLLTQGITPLMVTLTTGDANGDNSINIFDLAKLAEAFNTCDGESNYDPTCDFNCDGCVDIFDLGWLAQNFNQDGDP